MNKLLIVLISVSLLISCTESSKELEAESVAESQKDYTQIGDSIVGMTFLALSEELKNAMQSGGVANAVSYCNVHALALTDSLSQEYNAIIKRASDKPRNPYNQATEDEQRVLDVWYEKLAANEEIKPAIFEGDDKVEYYAAIKIKPLCLNCHGDIGSTLAVENYNIIKEKYPQDQAFGYKEGDLRGLWHISITK